MAENFRYREMTPEEIAAAILANPNEPQLASDLSYIIERAEKRARAAGRAEAVEGLRALSETAASTAALCRDLTQDDARFLVAAVNLIRDLLAIPADESTEPR